MVELDGTLIGSRSSRFPHRAITSNLEEVIHVDMTNWIEFGGNVALPEVNVQLADFISNVIRIIWSRANVN